MLSPNQEQGFSLFPLSEEPDHSLAVFAFSWLPNRGTPPHDHGTWAVVAGVLGPEWNTFWRRLDDGTRPGYAKPGHTLGSVRHTSGGCSECEGLPYTRWKAARGRLVGRN